MPVLPEGSPFPPGLATTASELINSAFRLIGVLGAEEIPPANMSNLALGVLNQMIDAMTAQQYMNQTVARTVFNPTVLKQTYTLGPNGDFNMPRPPRVPNISILTNQGQQELELQLSMLNVVEWQNIPVKNTQSALAQCCYNDNSFPLMNLNFWPIVNATPFGFAIYSWFQNLDYFADLSKTAYMFAQGNLKMLRYNLAVDLAGEFGGDAEKFPLILKIAQDSKALVKSINIPEELMTCEVAVLDGGRTGIYNWLSDTFVGHQ